MLLKQGRWPTPEQEAISEQLLSAIDDFDLARRRYRRSQHNPKRRAEWRAAGDAAERLLLQWREATAARAKDQRR